MYRVGCIWGVQGGVYRVGGTGWCVQGWAYSVGCTGWWGVQGWVYRVVGCTVWEVQGGVYRVGCTDRVWDVQGGVYRVVWGAQDGVCRAGSGVYTVWGVKGGDVHRRHHRRNRRLIELTHHVASPAASPDVPI